MSVATVSAVTFVTPPPGLSPLVEFELEAIDDADGLYSLRSLEAPDIRLFVIDALMYVPDYDPDVTHEQLDAIGAETVDDVHVLVVTTITDDGPIANLMAPIYLVESSGSAMQVIHDSDRWPLRAPLGR